MYSKLNWHDPSAPCWAYRLFPGFLQLPSRHCLFLFDLCSRPVRICTDKGSFALAQLKHRLDYLVSVESSLPFPVIDPARPRRQKSWRRGLTLACARDWLISQRRPWKFNLGSNSVDVCVRLHWDTLACARPHLHQRYKQLRWVTLNDSTCGR